jgi:hypothetical protein
LKPVLAAKSNWSSTVKQCAVSRRSSNEASGLRRVFDQVREGAQQPRMLAPNAQHAPRARGLRRSTASASSPQAMSHNASFCYFLAVAPARRANNQKTAQTSALNRTCALCDIACYPRCLCSAARSSHAPHKQLAWRSHMVWCHKVAASPQSFLITNALTRGYVPPPTLGGWRFAPNPARVQPVHPPRGFPLPRAGLAPLPFAANCFPLQVHGTASVPAAPMARESSPTHSPPPLLYGDAAPRLSVNQGQAASPLKNCGLLLATRQHVPQFFKP